MVTLDTFPVMSVAPSPACTKVQRSTRTFEIELPLVPSMVSKSDRWQLLLLGDPHPLKLMPRIKMLEAGSEMFKLRAPQPVASIVTPFMPLARPSIVTLDPMVRPASGARVTVETANTTVLFCSSRSVKQEEREPSPDSAEEVTRQVGCPAP